MNELELDKLSNKKPPETFQELLQELSYPYNNKQILESLLHLCEQVALRAQEYDLIVSDEVSARFVTLVVNTVVNDIKSRYHKDKAMTLFLVGGRMSTEQQRQLRVKLETMTQKNRKVLYVTQAIVTGNSVLNTMNLFQQNGFDATIACLSVSIDELRKRNIKNYLKLLIMKITGKIIYGTTTHTFLRLNGNDHLLGVTKSIERADYNPHPEATFHPARYPRFPQEDKYQVINPESAPYADQTKINKVRKDANMIAQFFLRKN